MKYVLLQGITNLDKQFCTVYFRNQNLYIQKQISIVNFYEKTHLQYKLCNFFSTIIHQNSDENID